jgi:hypothetical protein
MKNFLKNLLRVQTFSTTFETNNWIYKFSYLWFDIDLFIINISFGIVYWIKRESFEERNRWFNEYLENIFEQFELTDVAAPAKKKPATKKAATKKKTTTKK